MSLLWRDTGKTVRFFGVDGRATAGLALALLHISSTTLTISFVLIVFFALLERFDYTIPNAARKLRILISGKKKRSKPLSLQRKYRTN